MRDLDPIEEKIGVSVTEMNHDQLLSYFEDSKRLVLGVKVAIGGFTAQTTFKGFQRRYGREDAGRIVKYAVNNKKCRSPSGDILTPSSFAEGNLWITDTFHAELQLEQKRTQTSSTRTQSLKEGFFSLKDL